MVEMMVVCVVAFLIMALLADMFIEALQRTNDGRMRVDMQQKAIFAINKWERDLEKTSARAMTIVPGDPFCVAMTPVNVDISPLAASGSANWKKQITSWAFIKSQRVWQREQYPPKQPAFSRELSETIPYLPTSSELINLTSQVSGQEKIICDQVEDFSLTDRNGNMSLQNAVQPLIFRLKLRRTLSTSQRTAEFTIERRYSLRNDF